MAYHRKSAPKKGKRPDGTYGDLTPVTDEEGARLLKEKRNSVELLFDTIESWKKIPPDRFRDFFFMIADYAINFERADIPDSDWGMKIVYEMTCNQLDVYADRWLDSWIPKSIGGRNSAAGRAAKREKQDKTNDSTSNKPIPPPQYADDMLLETALESGTIIEVLQEYAKQHNLWIPPGALCKEVSRTIEMFHGQSLEVIYTFLRREFEDASDDNEMTADMHGYYRRYREGLFKL